MQEGCTDATYNLTAPYLGCQLVAQRLTQPGTGRPVLLVPAPAFTGGAPWLRLPSGLQHGAWQHALNAAAAPALLAGAPLRLAPKQVPGYDAYPGLGFWYRFDYSCDDAVSQPGSCGLEGGPARWAARCDADTRCGGIVDFPAGRDYPGPGAAPACAAQCMQRLPQAAAVRHRCGRRPQALCGAPQVLSDAARRVHRAAPAPRRAGQPVVLLKGDPDGRTPLSIDDANVNLNVVFYRKQAPGGTDGSGLGGGAIVGIAAAAACALAALAAAVFVVRRRWRRAAEAAKLAQVRRKGAAGVSVSHAHAAHTPMLTCHTLPAFSRPPAPRPASQKRRPPSCGPAAAPATAATPVAPPLAASPSLSLLRRAPRLVQRWTPLRQGPPCSGARPAPSAACCRWGKQSAWAR